MYLTQKFLNIFEFTGYSAVGKQMALLDIVCGKRLEFPRKRFVRYFRIHQ